MIASPGLENVARIAVAVLLNSLWEDAILVGIVWFLLRITRETNASTRYFSWLLTLIAAMALPIVTTIPVVSSSAQAHISSQTSRPPQRGALFHTDPRLQVHPRAVQQSPANAQGSLIPRLPNRLTVALPTWLASAIFSIWLLVTLAVGIRLAFDFYRLERLKRDSLPLPFDVRDQMERWVAVAYGKRRDVRICVSDKIAVPVAVGLFDSMILLPRRLLEQLTAGDLDRISLHELAHLHRNDDSANALQRIAQTIFFFNPAIRYIGSQLDLEREVACDDWVLSLTGDVRPYATCLTKMAELTAWPHAPLAAPGVFVTRKGISVRIERLLNKHRNARAQTAYGVPMAVTVAMVAFFFLVEIVAPSIAYTDQTAAATVRRVSNKVTTTVTRVTWIAARRVALPVRATRNVPPKPALPARSPRATVITKHIDRAVAAVPMLAAPRAVHASIPQVHLKLMAPLSQVSVPPVNVRVPEINVHVPGMQIRIPTINAQLPSLSAGSAQKAGPGYSCSGCDFSNVNWPGKDLSHGSFSGSDFSGANLMHANFTGTHLSGVDFSRANLAGANFSNANLSGSELSHANLSGTIFAGARLSGLSGLNPDELDPAQIRVLLDQCSGCDFSRAHLRGMDLHGIHLSGNDLSRADLRGANLQGVEFLGVDLSGALLQGASLRDAHFSGCDFSHTDLRNVDLTGVSFSGSDLREAIMK